MPPTIRPCLVRIPDMNDVKEIVGQVEASSFAEYEDECLSKCETFLKEIELPKEMVELLMGLCMEAFRTGAQVAAMGTAHELLRMIFTPQIRSNQR